MICLQSRSFVLSNCFNGLKLFFSLYFSSFSRDTCDSKYYLERRSKNKERKVGLNPICFVSVYLEASSTFAFYCRLHRERNREREREEERKKGRTRNENRVYEEEDKKRKGQDRRGMKLTMVR